MHRNVELVTDDLDRRNEGRRRGPLLAGWLKGALVVIAGLIAGADRTAPAAETPAKQADEGFVPLFNGQDLSGWYKYQEQTGKDNDPEKLIQVHDGMIHMYKDAAAGSRVALGGISTEAEYADYDLRLEYKWGEKQFEPRLKMKPDAGVLYHCYGENDVCGPWPRSNEFQIQTGDTGDIIAIYVQLQTTVEPKEATGRDPGNAPRYLTSAAGGRPLSVGDASHLGFVSKSETADAEGWNTIELQVRGDSATHLVNGKVVNRCTGLKRLSPGDPTKWVPLTQGKILIQAEATEIMYRNIQIRRVSPQPAAAPLASGLRVGAAAAEFQADDSMEIGGSIGPQFFQGQEGQLRAVATVLELPGSGKFAIVGCDVLFLTKPMIDRAAAEIEKSCGIPPEHLLVNATHTHHAPSTVSVHGTKASPAFTQSVEDGIVKAVSQANAHLVDDCQFLFHLGNEPDIGQNSRMLMSDNFIHWIGPFKDAVRPTGPFDPQLPVLVFRGADDKLVSVLYNHSTHTIGSLRSGVRSPAFYGLAAQAMEKQWDVPICFLEGASGSTHKLNCSVPDAIEKLERDLTEGVVAAARRKVNRIAAIKRPFRFKVRTFDEETEDRKVIDYCSKRAPAMLDLCTNTFRLSRLELKPQQGQERETCIQVIVIENVALVGVPAEYFTSLGVDIKQRSPFKETYIAELANDWIGYLPDREGHKLGGYQTWMGSHSFAEEGTGERIADEIVSMLEGLARP